MIDGGLASVPNRSKFHSFEIRARIFKLFKESKNRFQGINSASQCSLAVWYDNPIPIRYLALGDCLKIPAQYGPMRFGPVIKERKGCKHIVCCSVWRLPVTVPASRGELSVFI
jgi:hypothetical protein